METIVAGVVQRVTDVAARSAWRKSTSVLEPKGFEQGLELSKSQQLEDRQWKDEMMRDGSQHYWTARFDSHTA